MACTLLRERRHLAMTVSARVAMSNDEDHWALRAELEARREEVATLRGVVAALRAMVATRRNDKTSDCGRRGAFWVLVAASGVGGMIGFALALAVVQCLRH
jgi:hypothetical protein